VARIAILFHENEAHHDHSRYVVHHLARFWRERGDEVIYLFGPDRFVPADVVIVHVDLTVVPERYLGLTVRYPVAVNARLRDIRKSRISRQLVRPGDGWQGPVVMKSNLNNRGRPERVLGRNWLERHWKGAGRLRDAWERFTDPAAPLRQAPEYAVLDTVDSVPASWWNREDVVIERFLPEREDGLYHLRMVLAFGDRLIGTRLAAPDPIVKAANSVRTETIEPDPVCAAWRREFGLDYGKLDYVVHEGQPTLLDVNKTVGASRSGYRPDADLIAARRHLAGGIDQYLP